MPQKRSEPEPEVMTWGKALPAMAGAAVVDALRFFFTLFWFFGPALAALYCESTVGGWVGSLWGFTGAACSAGAVVAGSAASAVTAPFGVIMAGAVGLFGFLAVGLWIALTNRRILETVKNAPLQFAGAFAVGEIPLIGAFPVLSVMLWKLYATQIKVEKAAHAKWEKEQAALRQQEREQQREQLMRAQVTQVAEANQQAANEAVYAEATNDAIPEEVRRSA